MASNTLFVSNFPFTTTEDELRETFEAIGAISSVRIILDRDTGRSRGFAFVEFGDAGALDVAIERLNETEFRGRRLVVSKARGRAPANGAAQTPPARAPLAAQVSGHVEGPSPFRHRIVIDWSDEEGAYTASVPDLGVSAHAATIEAALRQVQSRVATR
jgi:RNA recognition motif-containing protein